MDRIEKLENELKLMQRRLETTLDIIMEHFGETDERLEELMDIIEEIQSGTSKDEQ